METVTVWILGARQLKRRALRRHYALFKLGGWWHIVSPRCAPFPKSSISFSSFDVALGHWIGIMQPSHWAADQWMSERGLPTSMDRAQRDKRKGR